MKLSYNKKSADPTYYAQIGIRTGKKVTTKNIERIGKHSELLKITDDPLKYAKDRVAELNRQLKEDKVSYSVTIDFDEKVRNNGSKATESTLKNVGYLYLKSIYDRLDLKSYFSNLTEKNKIAFNPNEINLAVATSRILDPGSKRYLHKNINRYYGEWNFSYEQILKMMDLIADDYDGYLAHLFNSSSNIIQRNNSICYFDCTNFYFEKEEEDDDYIDEVTGEPIKGLLKYGISKQHMPNPLVQMGLFMDADGLPLTMCINSGSDSESLCVVPCETKMLKMFKDKDIIYCADAGLGYTNARLFNSFAGRKFVVTQSVKKLSDPIKQAVFNDYDYKFSGNSEPLSLAFMKSFDRKKDKNKKYYDGFIYKSVEVDKLLDLGLTEERRLKNGKIKQVKSKAALKQRIIITYSRKMAEYQKSIRSRQIERAEKLLKNIDPDTYKKGPNDVTRFIKSNRKDKSYELDTDRISEEEKYDGFYAVATNIFDMDECEIIKIQKRRYKIEESFRILKTNFGSRPVFHYTRKRIIAHFMICFTCLLIYRILEASLDRNGAHFTTDEIIGSLNNMNVSNNLAACYQACYTGSDLLDSLEQLFDLKLNHKYYKTKDLNKLAKI